MQPVVITIALGEGGVPAIATSGVTPEHALHLAGVLADLQSQLIRMAAQSAQSAQAGQTRSEEPDTNVVAGNAEL